MNKFLSYYFQKQCILLRIKLVTIKIPLSRNRKIGKEDVLNRFRLFESFNFS